MNNDNVIDEDDSKMNNYNDDWDNNDFNQIATSSIHGALSSALAQSVDSRADDMNNDDSKSKTYSRPQNVKRHHYINNSLIDPLIETPISHGALSSALAHSIIDSNSDNDHSIIDS